MSGQLSRQEFEEMAAAWVEVCATASSLSQHVLTSTIWQACDAFLHEGTSSDATEAHTSLFGPWDWELKVRREQSSGLEWWCLYH